MQGLYLGLLGGGITAISTIVGGALFLIKNQQIIKILQKINGDFIIGVMLTASGFSLIYPAYSNFKIDTYQLLGSIILGSFFIGLIKYIMEKKLKNIKSSKKIIFIIAMMAHNFPEGLASGSSLNLSDYTVLSAISLQNIPEGLITTLSFISIGLSPLMAFIANLSTGIIEFLGGILGGIIGYKISDFLPLMMGFAGGAMLHVSICELIDRIKEVSFKALINPQFFLGAFLMSILSGQF